MGRLARSDRASAVGYRPACATAARHLGCMGRQHRGTCWGNRRAVRRRASAMSRSSKARPTDGARAARRRPHVRAPNRGMRVVPHRERHRQRRDDDHEARRHPGLRLQVGFGAARSRSHERDDQHDRQLRQDRRKQRDLHRRHHENHGRIGDNVHEYRDAGPTRVQGPNHSQGHDHR